MSPAGPVRADRSASTARAPVGGLALALLTVALLGAVLAYSPGLDSPFLFDDERYVRDNATLLQLWPPGWLHAGTQETRPFTNLSFALDIAMLGTEPRGHHLVNLGLHLASVVLLFLLLLRLRPADGPSGRIDGGLTAAVAAPQYGAGLAGCNGLIQNNIIGRNLIYCDVNDRTHGSAFYNCTGTIRNNTIIDNVEELTNGLNPVTYAGGGLYGCTGAIYNNIIWVSKTGLTPEYAGNTPPRFCNIKDWSGGGEGNIFAEPRFKDAVYDAEGTYAQSHPNDYHLKVDSPCIDAGMTTTTLTTDIEGNPRGRVWIGLQSLGDGSHTDMGAYEFNPGPLSMWIPSDTLPAHAGGPLTIHWVMDPALGDRVQPELDSQGAEVGWLAWFSGSTANQTYDSPNISRISIRSWIPPGDDYTVRGRSTISEDAPWAETDPFSILPGSVTAAGPAWTFYQ